MLQTLHLSALLLATSLPAVGAITKELYTTNAVCRQRHCINPLFPGLADLPDLGSRKWTKASLTNISSFLEFCTGFIDYDPAVPEPNRSTSVLERYVKSRHTEKGVVDALPHIMSSTEESVRTLDKQALRTYFMHLQAMGIEAWDHTEPLKDSPHPLRPCARSVARFACFTYFPRVFSGLPDGTEIAYNRPCKSTCEDYISACGVECCDDSTSCVWDRYGSTGAGVFRTTQDVNGKNVVLDSGYVDGAASSFHCT